MPLSRVAPKRLVIDRDAAQRRSAQQATKQLRLRGRKCRIIFNPAGQQGRRRNNYPLRLDRQPIGEDFYSGAILLDEPNRRRKVKCIAKLRSQANSELRSSAIYQVRLGYCGVDEVFEASAAAGEHH